MNTLWREKEFCLWVCVCVFHSCGRNCCLGVCVCECVCVNTHGRADPSTKNKKRKILFHLCMFHLDEIFNTIIMAAVKNYHVINK